MTIAELEQLCLALVQRVTELYARFEALRSLLQQHGSLSAEEFAQRAQELQQRHRDACEAEAEADKLAALRHLLESHEGTKH